MDKRFTSLQLAYFALSVISIGAGCMGMVLSFLYLASGSMADITAGTSGFVAGSVLIGSGIVSLTMLSLKSEKQGASDQSPVGNAGQ